MSAPKKYPVELRDRAIRLVEDLLADEQLLLSVTGACSRVAEQLGINRDTLRGWVKQAQIDAGAKPGLASAVAADPLSFLDPVSNITWHETVRDHLSQGSLWSGFTDGSAQGPKLLNVDPNDLCRSAGHGRIWTSD